MLSFIAERVAWGIELEPADHETRTLPPVKCVLCVRYELGSYYLFVVAYSKRFLSVMEKADPKLKNQLLGQLKVSGLLSWILH